MEVDRKLIDRRLKNVGCFLTPWMFKMVNTRTYKKHFVKHANACTPLGYFRMGKHVYITGLKSNQTVFRSATLAEHVDNDGTCHGSTYSDPYGTWTDVIVLATLTFTLVDYEATVRLNTNKVILRK